MNLLFLIDNSLSVREYVELYLQTINNITGMVNYFSKFTCATFNNKISYICKDHSLRNITRQEIEPTGSTAFYDCFSTILNNEQNSLNTVVIILTDGDDNSSRYTSLESLKLKIQNLKQNKGFKFIFLGTTNYSMNVSKRLGFDFSILYNPTKKYFENIPEVIKCVFNGTITRSEIDMNDILNSFEKIKI